MTTKEKAIRWFENIACECDKLTSGNVAHLRAQIKGMAIRSAEYLKKQEPASEDFESEWKRYCDSKGGGAITMNIKDMAHHFAQWGAECVKKSQKTLHVAKSYKEKGDSLTDEELKIAAGKYAYYEREDDIKGEGGYDLSKLEGFIEGAQWQLNKIKKEDEKNRN